jgi:hypothetical protein
MTSSSRSEPEAIEAAERLAKAETLPSQPPPSRWIGWLPILVLPLAAVLCRNLLPAWAFMWALAFAIFASLKWLTWWRARARILHPLWRSVAYLAAWPGMDADAFLDTKQRVPLPPPRAWLWAALKTILGATLLWVVP